MDSPDVRWLHDAAGRPIAFIHLSEVYLPDGTYLGTLDGHEVWNTHYVGELYAGDRLVRKLYRPLGTREEQAERTASPLPNPLPDPPPPLPAVLLPSDLHELEVEEALKPDFLTYYRKNGEKFAM